MATAVLISGAGIGGPTLAYWLARNGFEPTLVETAPRPRTGGYVIDFWGAGFDVADRMGLIPELMRRGYHVKEVRLVDESGRRAGGFCVDIIAGATKGRFVSLPRSELALAIYSTIEHRCETIFGDSITRIDAVADGVIVQFEKATARRFDLVIGADGLHSTVRKCVFGPECDFESYLGYKVAAFETVGYRPRDELIYVAYGVPGRQIARFAMRDDKTLFFFVFTDDEGTKREPDDVVSHKATLRRNFGSIGWESDAILGELDRSNEIYLDRVSQIHMRTWSRDRVALIGDAAFCPSLLAGEGAALAMVSAYVLAGELRGARGDHRTAFERYEARIRPLIAGKQKSAAKFAGTFAPRTRLGLTIRNFISKGLNIPLVAEYTLLRNLRDNIELPDYG